MRLVKPSFKILEIMELYGSYGVGSDVLRAIERAGRVCYKSEKEITEASCYPFIQKLLRLNHESVLEHSAMTVKFVCDRGVSHELVRHRLASYSQESTRYCNYKNHITFVIPSWVNIDEGEYESAPHLSKADINWFLAMKQAAETYTLLLTHYHWSPQQARSVLPNSLKTEIVMTANLREWRHVLKLRTAKAAHPQMRELMIPLLKELKGRIPIIFDDIEEEE